MRASAAILALLALVCAPAGSATAAAVFVSGEVPDWNQPYTYFPPPDGPGPNPGPGTDPFDAWCGPASASNLLGHWEDARGIPVADGIPFSVPGAPLPWPAPPIWHDWDLGDVRPAPGPSPPPFPADLGWFMDTNNSGSTSRGNGPHFGTYTKDLHDGLAEVIAQAGATSPGVGVWTTGTRGAAFAVGLDSSGAPAAPHPSAASAFAEIVGEVLANRTLILTWRHWNVSFTGSTLPPVPGATDESQFGGDYYTIASGSPGPDPWGNDEVWPEDVVDPALNLGHIVTAVGYIPAGDPDDINAPGNPTDWVIVHDNVPGTVRNVIVPLTATEYAGHWVANTNAVRVGPAVPALGPTGRLALAALLLVVAVLAARAGMRRTASRGR